MNSILKRAAIVLALTLPLVASAQTARRRSATPAPAPGPAVYSASQAEAYVSGDTIGYIRPGLKIKVNSITIGSDRVPVADLTITDDLDQPLDRNGKATPGTVSISLILAWYNPATRQYTAYTTRSVTTPATSPRPGVTAIQAGADSGGTFTDLDIGHATYKFKTVLPAGFDQTKTHTLGIYASRNLTTVAGIPESVMKTYYANVEYDFRPDGQKVTEAWDKMRDASTCSNCHDSVKNAGSVGQLGMHGGSRQDVKLCSLCHTPQTVDPDTGNTVDLKVMVHKIHRGKNLPSVKNGDPYVIIGNAQSVHDFSSVGWPQLTQLGDTRQCATCHEGTSATNKGVQSSAWFTNPSRDACGSCHDDVNFATGQNHPGGIQKDDKACASCHVPESENEFDASIKGAHMVPEKSKQLKGLTATIVSGDMGPGKKPTVTFKIVNGDGTAVDGTKLTTFSPICAGPTTSYGKPYWREDARSKGVFDAAKGTTTYTFLNPLPADASGTWTFSADIYRNVNLKRGDGKADITIREAAMNPIKYIALTGGLTPRRTSVTIAQCNSCHDSLALHGGQRLTTEECVICHNPVENDAARRPANAGAPESVSFQRLIHRIHKGEELTQDFTIYGFGGSANNFNEVRFPGDLRNCAKCHASNSYQLPLATGIANVNTPRDYFASQGPATAACLGCHDNKDAAAHAYLNTTTFPGATISAEACATCHGAGKDWAAEKVHAR